MHIQEARNNVFQINFLLAGNSGKKICFAVGKLLFFSSFFPYFKELCTSRKPEIMFSILFVCLLEIRKKYFSLSANFYFFQLKNLFNFFLFLGPMHTQEARNNVFQTNFLLAGNSGKIFFAVGKLLFFPAFFLFLGPMHIQEARNNVSQIICLLAG